MIYVPEFDGSILQWIVLVFAAAAPLMFLSEATGFFSLGYSKFAKQEQAYSVPSRLGMFILYAPAVVLFPLVLWAEGVTWTPWHVVVTALMMLHFGKRCAETLWVHKYSGVMNGWTVVLVCGMYSAVSAVLGGFAATEVTATLAESEDFTRLIPVGVSVWLLGTFTNGFHHVVLARLRKPGETGYKLPRGGLFEMVACPHYLGEIIAWIGYAIVFHHAAAFGATLTMTAYLMGRSHNTVKWYRSRVDGVPANWKRLVPGLY